MGGFGLSKRSRDNLVGVHPKMVEVVKLALSKYATVDFMVIEGVRTQERQNDLYAQGRTKPGRVVTWTKKSNHFVNPRTGYGHAVDLCPAPVDWNSTAKFNAIAKAMFQAADELDIPIRWGKDWDRDGTYGERGETDSPHFELWGVQ
jgi:peptidoglycan L-alanyl-D-glutamate endopeptidase CwlK